MKVINALIERSEDAFYAYVPDIPGCTTGGSNYDEVKKNLEKILEVCLDEDYVLKDKYKKGYTLKFEVDLESELEM